MTLKQHFKVSSFVWYLVLRILHLADRVWSYRTLLFKHFFTSCYIGTSGCFLILHNVVNHWLSLFCLVYIFFLPSHFLYFIFYAISNLRAKMLGLMWLYLLFKDNFALDLILLLLGGMWIFTERHSFVLGILERWILQKLLLISSDIEDRGLLLLVMFEIIATQSKFEESIHK